MKRKSLPERTAARIKHAEWLTAEGEKLDDWHVTCRRCGRKRVGFLRDLKKGCGCGTQSGS